MKLPADNWRLVISKKIHYMYQLDKNNKNLDHSLQNLFEKADVIRISGSIEDYWADLIVHFLLQKQLRRNIYIKCSPYTIHSKKKVQRH